MNNKSVDLNPWKIVKDICKTCIQCALVVGLLGIASIVQAGAYIFAGKSNGNDLILHPPGYTGTGGQVQINVCIAPGTAHEVEMEQSVRNIIAVYNQLLPTTGNLRTGVIAGSLIDFESVALHEVGHCLGQAHVNASSESGLGNPDINSTKATAGEDGAFNTNAGTDGVMGSSDDVRGDDVNLHWYRIDNNNPFTIDYSQVDSTTYIRDTASLPSGHLFVANGDRTVGNSLLSTPNTEAVMQQGTYYGEIQRSLTPDGVATLLYAMSGSDEIAGNSDDYTFHLNFITTTTGCDLKLQFSTGVGLAYCSVGGSSIESGHWRITSANMFYGEEYTWFFNTDAPCTETLTLTQNKWTMFTLPCSVGISTPNTVADILGDDLTGVYDTNWVVYEWDAANNQYQKLLTSDAMFTGKGYWVFTTETSQSFDVEGQFNGSPDILLYGVAGGRANMVGHPFDFSVDWSDIQVVDGALVKPLLTATAEGDLSETFHIWNGNAYDAFDATTAGMLGTLRKFDGIWLRANKDVHLRVPSIVSSAPSAASAGALSAESVEATIQPALSGKATSSEVGDDGSWFVRVIVESGDLRDSGNVLGQLPDSLDGQDKHDLEELAPFGNSYLTVIFPHEEWDSEAWAFTSDFHANSPRPHGEWTFAVRSSIDISEASLRFEGPDSILKQGQLRDLETGKLVKFSKGAYSFDTSQGTRYFSFKVGRVN